MKEKLILEISNSMAEILSVEQLAKLNVVLLKSIGKYTVSMGEEQAPSLATSNETLLKAFLSAKQVEGCSQPTIRYYGNTIKLLANNMPKRFTDFTTEDIRAYLAVFTPGTDHAEIPLSFAGKSVKDVKVIYPSGERCAYSFEQGVLRVDMPQKKAARLFVLTLG